MKKKNPHSINGTVNYFSMIIKKESFKKELDKAVNSSAVYKDNLFLNAISNTSNTSNFFFENPEAISVFNDVILSDKLPVYTKDKKTKEIVIADKQDRRKRTESQLFLGSINRNYYYYASSDEITKLLMSDASDDLKVDLVENLLGATKSYKVKKAKLPKGLKKAIPNLYNNVDSIEKPELHTPIERGINPITLLGNPKLKGQSFWNQVKNNDKERVNVLGQIANILGENAANFIGKFIPVTVKYQNLTSSVRVFEKKSNLR